MSGIDEQDVMPCGCGGFQYWTINDKILRLGYLNPDAWMESDFIRSINKAIHVKSISKDKFIAKIAYFHCHSCGKLVKRGHGIFERLCSDVRTRWNMESPFLPDGDK